MAQLIACLMRFLTLGIFWNGHQAQLNHLACSDRNLQIAGGIHRLPNGSADLPEQHWRCAVRAHLLGEETSPEVSRAIERRIVAAQALYAVGAALCVVNPYLSIAFIVLVQVNFALAWISRF